MAGKMWLFLMLFGCSFGAAAASPYIRLDWTSECAIWLCLPRGFPEGTYCDLSKEMFIGRLTDYVGHHKRYTDIPAWSVCAIGG